MILTMAKRVVMRGPLEELSKEAALALAVVYKAKSPTEAATSFVGDQTN